MRSWSFLLSRRWALFGVIVIGLAYATWWLGGWQFGRLHDRRALNSIVRTNEHRDPTPVEDVLAVGAPVPRDQQYRLVTATGTYEPDKTIVVRYQTYDGASGVDLVVPLLTSSGRAVLVDRGWYPSQNGDVVDRSQIPVPPSGYVEVTGWVRQDGSGGSIHVDDLSTRAISSTAIGPAIGLPTLGGFVDLRSESPGQATGAAGLKPVELPALDDGPHFFYGLQWWFFGLLAVFGFFYLMFDEYQGGPRRERVKVERKPVPGRRPMPEKPQRATAPPTAAQLRKAARRRAIEAGLVKARAEKAAKHEATKAGRP